MIWPVSVIVYWYLGFICYLVLVVWNLKFTGPTLLFVFCLLRFDMNLPWSTCGLTGEEKLAAENSQSYRYAPEFQKAGSTQKMLV